MEEKISSKGMCNNNTSSISGSCNNSVDSTSMSIDEDVLMRNSSFSRFSQGMDLNLARMVGAEMVGTFVLIFCVCGITASIQITRGEAGLMEYAATAGLTVVVVVFSIGSISGAHVNPAVTIAFAAFSDFPWSRVPLYITAQIMGSVLATYIGRLVYGLKPELVVTRPIQGCVSAFFVELIATFIMVFLVASLSHQAQTVGHLTGFLVGISIALAVLITGPISGGSMNPARSLGPSILAWTFKDLWIYISAPIMGAILGALVYKLLHIKTQTPFTSSPSPDSSLLQHSFAFRS